MSLRIRSSLLIGIPVLTLCVTVFPNLAMPSGPVIALQISDHEKAKYQNNTLQVPSEISSLNILKAIPDFVFYDNISGIFTQGSATYWKDPRGTCINDFDCVSHFSLELEEPTYEVRTMVSKNFTFSGITGGEVSVIPLERYLLTTQMKVNENTRQSHIAFEGYNETSRTWVQLMQCPPGTDGPKEWQMFRCTTTMPTNITKARPILAAGWTSQNGTEAWTRFGSIHLNHIDSSPILFDSSLGTEVVYEDLRTPSAIGFLDDDDFLIIEKNSGTVERVTNGTKLESPLIDLNVTSTDGLIGLAIDKPSQPGKIPQVYLYYTASESGDCTLCSSTGNKLVRYDLEDNMTRLTNEKILLDVPAPENSSAMHNGGPILIGPDDNVYLSVGDLHSIPESGTGNAWSIRPLITHKEQTLTEGQVFLGFQRRVFLWATAH